MCHEYMLTNTPWSLRMCSLCSMWRMMYLYPSALLLPMPFSLGLPQGQLPHSGLSYVVLGRTKQWLSRLWHLLANQLLSLQFWENLIISHAIRTSLFAISLDHNMSNWNKQEILNILCVLDLNNFMCVPIWKKTIFSSLLIWNCVTSILIKV